MANAKINIDENSKRNFLEQAKNLLTQMENLFNNKKFDINVDTQGIKSQFDVLKNEISSFEKEVSQSKPELNMNTEKVKTNLDEIKEQIKSIYGEGKKDLTVDVKVNTNDALATLKSLDGQLNKKVKINVVGHENGIPNSFSLPEDAFKSLTDKSESLNQKQNIKDQNQLYSQAETLLNEKYKIENAINDAEKKGYTNTVNQLNAMKEENQLKLNQITPQLNDSNNEKIINQEIELINKKDLAESTSIDKIKQENEAIEKQIELYKQQMEIKLQNLNTSGGKAINTEGIKSEIQAIKDALASLNIENYEDMTKKINTQLKQTQANVREINTEAKSASGFFGDILHNTAKFVEWSVSATILMTMVNSFKEMLDYTSQLDKSITNIQMITDRSYQSAKNLTDQYRQLAQNMGQNDTDFLSGAENYLRAGLTDTDTKKMLQANAVASSISGVSNSDMENNLQTMKDAFGLTVDQINQLIDKLSTLDNKSSASFAGIVTGMQKSAAGAQQVGIQYDKLAAYVSTIEDVSHKNPDTVGQSLQSIFSRLENVKAGASEDNVNINDVEKVLSKPDVGVSLRSASGEWKNMGTVIDEIASKWKNLDSVTQSQIATVVAGEFNVA